MNPYHSKVEEPAFATAIMGRLLKKYQIAGTRICAFPAVRSNTHLSLLQASS